ncbi:MAG TPA: hypothetical protein VNO31_24075 [Umezawaea sp.]|nr:hypothetical protein [Umezawaea sp.]
MNSGAQNVAAGGVCSILIRTFSTASASVICDEGGDMIDFLVMLTRSADLR